MTNGNANTTKAKLAEELKTVATIVLASMNATGKAAAVPYRMFFSRLIDSLTGDLGTLSMADIEATLTKLFDDSSRLEREGSAVFLDVELAEHLSATSSAAAIMASPTVSNASPESICGTNEQIVRVKMIHHLQAVGGGPLFIGTLVSRVGLPFRDCVFHLAFNDTAHFERVGLSDVKLR